MKNSGMKFLPIGLFCLLPGCSHYQPEALTEQAVELQLETPAAQQLSVQAAQIKHPLLKPIPFNIQDGLSPDEAAVLAVLRNPELRAARDQSWHCQCAAVTGRIIARSASFLQFFGAFRRH